MIALVVVAALATATAPTKDDARLLTSIVAAAVAKEKHLEVLTQEDLRKAVEVEAQAQAMGCSAEGCLAELAAAMGAGVVIFGSLGVLGDELVVELAAFDANAAKSQGRAVVRSSTIADLTRQAEAEARAFAAASSPAGEKRRVLVLDLELRNAGASSADAASTSPASPGLSGLQLAGVGAGIAGGLALVVGGACDFLAVQTTQEADAKDDAGDFVKTTTEAQQAYASAGTFQTVAIVGYVAGGVLAAAGVALFFVGGE